MKLATSTGDIGSYLSDKSIAAPIPYLKEAGFKHLDMSFYSIIYPGSPWLAPGDGWKKEVEDCLKAAEQYGVDFVQSHAPDGEHFVEGEKRDALILATKRSIEACAMLGCPNTVVHSAPIHGAAKEVFTQKNVEFLRLFENDAEKYNVEILSENSADLWNPEYYANTGLDLLALVKAADMPMLHICWDTGHGNVQGLNQYKELTDMGGEIHAFHIQDNYGDNDSHVMPMTGTTNFDQILRGMRDIGYKGVFTFEGGNTIRRSGSWPNYRREILPSDRLANVPVAIQQKQLAVMYEIGKWMLESYGIEAE